MSKLGIAIQDNITWYKDELHIKKIIEAESEIIRDQIINNNVDTIMLNGEIGYDRLVFDLVNKFQTEEFNNLKIQLILPFRFREATFELNDKKMLMKHIKLADEVIYVDEIEGYKVERTGGEFNRIKIMNMNKYIMDHCDAFNTTWDGRKQGYKFSYLKYATKLNKPIVIYNDKKHDIAFFNWEVN